MNWFLTVLAKDNVSASTQNQAFNAILFDSNQISSRLNAAELVGRKFKNRNAAAREVLLVSNILIGSDEQIKFVFCSFQQLAIFISAPIALLRRQTLMSS